MEGERGAQPAGTQRFVLDVRGERQSMMLRQGAAYLVLCAGAWQMALPYAVPRAFAVAGFVFAALWLVGSLRTRRVLQNAHEHFLELDAAGIGLCEGGTTLRVPWQEVQSVAINHDRLHIVVVRTNAQDLVIEPRYQGMDLQKLAETLSRALKQGRLESPQNDSRGALGTQDG